MLKVVILSEAKNLGGAIGRDASLTLSMTKECLSF